MIKGMLAIFLALAMLLPMGYRYGRSLWYPFYVKMVGQRTVEDVIYRYGYKAESRLKPYFTSAGLNFPPQEVSLLTIKDQLQMELWAKQDNNWHYVRTYPLLANSGTKGPKLRQGDKQIPEGLYKITFLNPNSRYHLSMKLNYPNAFDQQKAVTDGRTRLGGDIFIHGKDVSIGCLAVGDQAIEELFTLVHRIGKRQVSVVIAPTDPRLQALKPPLTSPRWTNHLYQQIAHAFTPYSHPVVSANHYP
ncbi:L,D-transpeptidase family protein [Zooshikella ganghwensis]|uniref:L,D-transpeptidase family protein n=1 Tax=Zooshikella ganghwensis TaxID=202772 RepID=UPI001B7FE0FD|nr:L,D-transpeptidase family protein [Zooshikella ganghwensis]